MAKGIEINGRARYFVVGGGLILLLVSIISPSLRSSTNVRILNGAWTLTPTKKPEGLKAHFG